MERQNTLNRVITILLAIIFIVGMAGHALPAWREQILSLTPWVLLITSAMVIYSVVKSNSVKVLYLFAAIYIITFFLEAAGVKTGLIFGEYYYGRNLGIKVLDVPLIIALNWVLIILGASGAASGLSSNKIIVPFIAGIICVLFDFILEPVAMKFDYWQWVNNQVPVLNYISWFIISVLISALLTRIKPAISSTVAQYYLAIQAVFFVIMNFI